MRDGCLICRNESAIVTSHCYYYSYIASVGDNASVADLLLLRRICYCIQLHRIVHIAYTATVTSHRKEFATVTSHRVALLLLHYGGIAPKAGPTLYFASIVNNCPSVASLNISSTNKRPTPSYLTLFSQRNTLPCGSTVTYYYNTSDAVHTPSFQRCDACTKKVFF